MIKKKIINAGRKNQHARRREQKIGLEKRRKDKTQEPNCC